MAVKVAINGFGRIGRLVMRAATAAVISTLLLISTGFAAEGPVSPVAYRTASIDGLSIFYREAGPPDAPTIVLLHGLPSSSRMYEPLLRRQQSFTNALTLDRRLLLVLFNRLEIGLGRLKSQMMRKQDRRKPRLRRRLSLNF